MWNRVIKSITLPIFVGLMLLFSVGFKSVEVCCACICTQVAPEGCPMERLATESWAGHLFASLPIKEGTMHPEKCLCNGGEDCSDCVPKVEVLHVDSYTLPKDSSESADCPWITLSEVNSPHRILPLVATAITPQRLPTPPAPPEGRHILSYGCVLRI
ncbi:hypothetical protein [Porphyromonas circumdentaria]|uniref:Uncharacterized protein n=1 Tax=Porphyromonas circumdentaria TaxID=29524 RepID=A0A1T4MPQ6_9PORP|nr:hypothetical protein [Porphyromonas circumdentaria]MBB6275896.1 hypothetical protein [Porphyromonas circumdentaria]MDO4722656.1 hypothetical protein [Porphyromonas circumdentaria]SJZ68817.1 hypothetical protein SAMN02745171_00856 [Porphyromonas circumdentaria]